MVHFHEQLFQENIQRIRDWTEPDPVRASLLAQMQGVERNLELARSLGIVFPEENLGGSHDE